MTSIALYVEGGGDTAQQKADLRRGLDSLLKFHKKSAMEKRIEWKLVPCGTRRFAYEAFLNASKGATNDAYHFLLVDSEDSVSDIDEKQILNGQKRVSYLSRRDDWELSSINPELVHLMVQCMEAWILADPEALNHFYGQGFKTNLLPRHANLEKVPKADLENSLKRATEGTQKGKYGKIRHASKLLGLIDPIKIANRCPHFALFQQSLTRIVNPGASA